MLEWSGHKCSESLSHDNNVGLLLSYNNVGLLSDDNVVGLQLYVMSRQEIPEDSSLAFCLQSR